MDKKVVERKRNDEGPDGGVSILIILMIIGVTYIAVNKVGFQKVAIVAIIIVILKAILEVGDKGESSGSCLVENTVETEKQKESEKKTQEEQKFSDNLPQFLEEARIKYIREVKKSGMPMEQYSQGPLEMWSTVDGFIVVPKWEFYEDYIKNDSTYRNDIIKKTSGNIVKIDLIHVTVDDYKLLFDAKILESLKRYEQRVENRTEVDIKNAMEKDLADRAKYNTF